MNTKFHKKAAEATKGDFLSRIFSACRYSGDAYQALTASALGDSTKTIALGAEVPSIVSTSPPRHRHVDPSGPESHGVASRLSRSNGSCERRVLTASPIRQFSCPLAWISKGYSFECTLGQGVRGDLIPIAVKSQGSCYSDWIGESIDRILSVADSRCPVASTRCPTAPSPKGGML
jgi:hypothetical protein